MTSPVIFVLRDPDSGATEVRAFGCEPEMIVEIDLGRDDLSDPVVFDTWFGSTVGDVLAFVGVTVPPAICAPVRLSAAVPSLTNTTVR